MLIRMYCEQAWLSLRISMSSGNLRLLQEQKHPVSNLDTLIVVPRHGV